jgi:hypothetical protein
MFQVLTPQVHARQTAEAERADVIVELPSAHLLGDLRGADVAGVLEHASRGQYLGRMGLGVVDHVARHDHVIRNDELIGRRDRAAF